MKNKIRMIIEIIVIPLAITYLAYTFIKDKADVANIIFIVFTLVTVLELTIKSLKVIFGKGKKVIFRILSFLFIISNFLLLYLVYRACYTLIDYYYIYVLFGTLGILLIYLLVSFIIHLVKLTKDKGKLYTNVTTSLLSFLSFCIISLTTVLGYLNAM